MSKRSGFLLSLVGACVLLVAGPSHALAAPAWQLTALADTNVAPGDFSSTTPEINFHLEFKNIGDAELSPSGTVEFSATMPPGMLVTGVSGYNPFNVIDCSATKFPAATVSCKKSDSELPEEGRVRPGRGSVLEFETSVGLGAPLGPATAHFSISGGGAEAPASTLATTTISQDGAGFGLSAFDGEISGPAPANSHAILAGKSFTQAGGHPYDTSTTLFFNGHTDPNPFKGDLWPTAAPRDVVVDLPPGLIGNPSAVPQPCTMAELNHTLEAAGYAPEPLCPAGSQVGRTIVYFSQGEALQLQSPLPVFEMVPPAGIAARFAFDILGTVVVLDAKVHPLPGPGSGYGISILSSQISQGVSVLGTKVEFWGDPSAPSHDPERYCLHPNCTGASEQPPLLRMPTSCTQPGEGLSWSAHADSWVSPGEKDEEGIPLLSDPNWKSAGYQSHEAPGYPANPEDPTTPWGERVGDEGCATVPVKGTLSAQPSALETETPTGLSVKLTVPNPGLENPSGIASSDIKSVKVTLPEGVTINPSQAEGLGVCTPSQYASEQLSFIPTPGTGCPSDSKIGTVTVHTQLLREAIEGNVYIAQPDDPGTSEHGAENPFDSLLALYVVLKNPERGVMIKLPGKVEPDPRTGRISADFQGLPQLPFEDFVFKFREGARAPLVTPPVCGTYTTDAEITPWSDPSKTFSSQSNFEVTTGIGGGACPAGGTPPLNPSVISGSINPNAGSSTPFYLRIARKDGEQELTKFSTVLPPGLTGNLTGIPFCPNAAIEVARRHTGRQELAAPSCPAASEIGHTLVGAGVGSVLAWTPGKVYLAGPYHGSSLSIVSITSATVGPFDLGTVVIRFGLRINPITAQVEVDSSGSDPIPHIIDGIVVHVKDIHVYIDRQSFIRNPTSCNPMSISNTIVGAGADFTNPADQVPVDTTTRFQVANCANLGFKPSFKATTPGKTSRQNGAGFSVKLTYPNASAGSQANIRSVKVDLPKQLPSRLTTLQKACPDSTFNANPAACPPASRVGTAKAITPILPEPLTGPAYFVSHGGAKFPELILVIQGYGFTIDLHGETFISKTGITSSTFRTVPDEPVTSFELTLPQGPGSALAANGNLCKSNLRMPTVFTAQNGAVMRQSTTVAVTGCPRHKAHKATKAKNAKRGRK